MKPIMIIVEVYKKQDKHISQLEEKITNQEKALETYLRDHAQYPKYGRKNL